MIAIWSSCEFIKHILLFFCASLILAIALNTACRFFTHQWIADSMRVKTEGEKFWTLSEVVAIPPSYKSMKCLLLFLCASLSLAIASTLHLGFLTCQCIPNPVLMKTEGEKFLILSEVVAIPSYDPWNAYCFFTCVFNPGNRLYPAPRIFTCWSMLHAINRLGQLRELIKSWSFQGKNTLWWDRCKVVLKLGFQILQFKG